MRERSPELRAWHIYPLPENRLSLLEVARHWSRDLPQHPPWHEVFDRLLQAFWRADLRAQRSGDPETVDVRRWLLDALRLTVTHPRIMLLESAEDQPDQVTNLPDGGVSVDLRVPVIWPSASEARTASVFEHACAAMVKVGIEGIAETLHPAFVDLEVERGEFGRFCAKQGYGLPRFWFSRSGKPSTAGAATSCRRWLRAEMTGPKRMPKSKSKNVCIAAL